MQLCEHDELHDVAAAAEKAAKMACFALLSWRNQFYSPLASLCSVNANISTFTSIADQQTSAFGRQPSSWSRLHPVALLAACRYALNM